MMLLVLIVGVIGAAAIPSGVGIGWSLVVIALAGAGVIGYLRRADRSDGWQRLGWVVLTLLLAGAATVRANGWLVAACLALAACTGSLALDPARAMSWRGLAGVTLMLPRAAGGVAMRRPRRRMLMAYAAALVLLVVFGSLLAGADDRFAGLLKETLNSGLRWTVLFVLTGLVALAVTRAAASASIEHETAQRQRPGLARSEWVPAVAALDVLFAVFAVIQFGTWFGGHELVQTRGGPSYAEYAKAGFTLLLVVTVLTLAVVAVVSVLAERESLMDRVCVRGLVGALCVLALVVVTSALRRMALYAETFGFSRERITADAFILLLGLVFVCLLVAGVRLRAAWLPGAVVGCATIVLIGLVVVNPDALAARTIIDRYVREGHLDGDYLESLSADAAAEINRLPEPQRSCALRRIAADLAASDGWQGYNIGRQRARDLLAAAPTHQAVGCVDVYPHLPWPPPSAPKVSASHRSFMVVSLR